MAFLFLFTLCLSMLTLLSVPILSIPFLSPIFMLLLFLLLTTITIPELPLPVLTILTRIDILRGFSLPLLRTLHTYNATLSRPNSGITDLPLCVFPCFIVRIWLGDPIAGD